MSYRNQTTQSKAKAATREMPVGLIILSVAALYVALCLKVFSGL